MDRYHSFSRFLRRRFGAPVHKVCIDAGFSCPNLDGTLSTDGCSYCNNSSFSPLRRLNPPDVSAQIERGIAFLKQRYQADRFLAYFQSYCNTHAPLENLRRLFEPALDYQGVVGLDISTRPDCIDEEKLEYLQDLARNRFVLLEYGLQSSHDQTLRKINRGHDYACFAKALELTAGRGIHTCAHVIIGLPGENDEQILQTAHRLAELPLDFVKIHDLHVVRGTALGREYEQSPFPLRSRVEYVNLLIRFIELLPPRMALMRLFSHTPPQLLLAPTWDTDPNRLLRDIREGMERKDTWQGRLCATGSSRREADGPLPDGEDGA